MPLLNDLKFALRSLRRNPSSTAVAVLSLALGVGANSTIFTLLNGILLRPLPVRDPASLASLYTVDTKNPGYMYFSYPTYKDYRDRNTVFSSLILYAPIIVSANTGREPRLTMGHIVTGNYFSALGVKLPIGRGFLPEEDLTPGANPVTVISHGLWMRAYGSDPRITSRTIQLNGRQFRIIGVAPPGFSGISELWGADLWMPMAMYREVFPYPSWVTSRGALAFLVVGRLKPGLTLAQAERGIESVTAEMKRLYPDINRGRSIRVLPVADSIIGPRDNDRYRRTGTVLLIVSGLVLLIACGNVANLLLARGTARSREITVRLAIGAERWQLVRQLMAESALLACAGGLLGLLIAHWGRDVLWTMRPPAFKWAGFDLEFDYRVLGYTFGVSLLTSLLFGVFPALRSTRTDLATDLKERSGNTAPSGGKWPPRSILVMAQIAFSLVTLIGAGLFLRSMQNANAVDPGFDAAHLAIIGFNVGNQGYTQARGREYLKRAMERAAAVPGVDAVAFSKDEPLTVSTSRTTFIVGQDDIRNGQGRQVLVSVTSPGYLETVRIPLLRGRDFRPEDGQTSPKVAIVNEVIASHYWPGQDAVGKLIQFGGDNSPVEVIGVASNANYQFLGEPPQGMIYLSMNQYYFPAGAFYMRTHGDPDTVLGAVQREVHGIDPNLPLQPKTVRVAIRETLWAQSLSAALLSVFGGLALLLSGIGIYGVISYSVNLRIREIGVRMAIGATPGNVQSMVLREGVRLAMAGVAAGTAASVAASRLIESMLLRTSARDLTTFVAVPVILTGVAVLACWLPARRATRIDPAIALRDE
jgi:predicted permease